ncbi:extracellular exo-alpha-(1-_5)-L-arabinofuranosidase precursor [Streptomyces jeddahensis]|uniref:Extracellular exo-alpha-(1->5)-L-arabinofuranosidase n=1 Tax=Streptomyces jeddahensis TaxID=1716141 RepID=A0A177HHV1_9ACTN|nr:extracellular exo-alpha-(1->5)-L-arabinofuranosidase precursor [Streptomyces jeddahensis]
MTGSDPLNPAAWTKKPSPVFRRDDAAGVYGPGHNGFFTSPDGTENWIVYHANDSTTDRCGNERTTLVRPASAVPPHLELVVQDAVDDPARALHVKGHEPTPLAA